MIEGIEHRKQQCVSLITMVFKGNIHMLKSFIILSRILRVDIIMTIKQYLKQKLNDQSA